MKIEGIELTKEEINDAVSAFLKMKGLDVEVHEVETIGYPVKGWRVVTEIRETQATKKTLTEELREIAKGAAVINDEVPF